MGFHLVSKLQASLLSARWDIGSFFLSGLKNSNPKLTKALRTGGHGPFWSQKRGSSTHDSAPPLMLPVQHAAASLSPQALTPNLLSKCLGRRNQVDNAQRLGCSRDAVCMQYKTPSPQEEELSLLSGSRLRCKDRRSSD